MLKWLSEVFWAECFWLAPGVKWADVTNGPDKKIVYPEAKDFWYQIPLIVFLLVLRFLLEKTIFAPLGRTLGVTQKKKRNLQHISLLESAYRRSPQNKDVTACAKQLDMSERQVERWWRVRRNLDKPSNLAKFCEHSWKASYLIYDTLFGFYILWDKDWFWDLDKCYIGYPHQGVTFDIWLFYMINLAFTWSSMITVFRDVKRKDFWLMVVHHLLTGALLCISWMCSMFRIGAVLVPMQDSSEAVLEATKALKKAKYDRLCKYLFFIFAPMWFYTRMYQFSLYLYSTSVRGPALVKLHFAGFILNIMLFLLLILSVYWSVLVLIVVYNFLVTGIERDVRSSSSEVCSEDGTFSDDDSTVTIL